MGTLLLLLSSVLMAQTVPVPGPRVARIQEYLSLSDAQIETLIANVRTQATERSAQARRVDELRQALQQEAARENADAVTMGNLAAEREAVCREDRRDQAAVTERALAVLTAAQRTRLQSLEEARRLDSVMQEAQTLGLLDAGNIPVNAVVTPSLPGCLIPSAGGLSFRVGTPFGPTFAAKQYLNLSDAQYRVLSDNARRYSSTVSPLQTQMGALTQSIALETTREQLDPATLGALYAELAAICQAQHGQYRELRRSAESTLDDAQKRRLTTLQTAQSLSPAINEAQALALFPIVSERAGTFVTATLVGQIDFPLFIPASCPIP